MADHGGADHAGPGETVTGGVAAERLAARYLQVQTTTDSRAEAIELGHDAVAARLAACAQVTGPVARTYWWEDGLERAEEWLLMLKLPAHRDQALAEFLAARHSHDETGIVAVP